MPDKAYKDKKGGDIVTARECTIADKNKDFYCITPGCKAKMTLVSVGEPQKSHFRRIKSSPKHISTSCSKCSVIFYDSDYDESKFDKNAAFDFMISNKKEKLGIKTKKGTKTGTVGGGKPAVRTLAVLYSLCQNKKKTDSYNGILIDDLIADEENVARYGSGINGKLAVECTYYKKAYKEYALILNYPINFKKSKGHIKINFQDENLFWHYYNTLKTSDHTEIIVIAGDWKQVVSNPEYQSECIIYNRRQIYYIK